MLIDKILDASNLVHGCDECRTPETQYGIHIETKSGKVINLCRACTKDYYNEIDKSLTW